EGGAPARLPFGYALYLRRIIRGVEARTFETSDQAFSRLRNEFLGYLRGHAQRFRALDIDVVTDMMIGDAADSIITYARQVGVDLIATATHARSGVAHLLHPSVAEKVVRSGVSPVLLVRSENSFND